MLRSLAASGALLGAAGLVGCGDDDNGPVATEIAADIVDGSPPADPTATQSPISSPIASYLDPTRWAGRTLTIATFGGAYREAQTAAYFEPFEAATGVSINVENIGANDQLREQVDNKAVVFDVVCIATEEVLPLARDGYLEPINYAIVDRTTLFEEFDIAMQHGVGADFYSTGIIYRTDSGAVPQSWMDFWETSRFGDGRALRLDPPAGTFEFALLADGVPMDQLYPLDVERALASLDRIFFDVVSWYEDGQQPVQLVLNGQCGLASAWNVRVEMPGIAAEVAFQWNGAMLSADSWIVPRGTENANVAMDFINYATRAVPNANFARLLPFGPVNRDALALLRDDRLAVLPTSDENRSVQFAENWNYWADNSVALTARFRDWLEQDREDPATPETNDD